MIWRQSFGQYANVDLISIWGDLMQQGLIWGHITTLKKMGELFLISPILKTMVMETAHFVFMTQPSLKPSDHKGDCIAQWWGGHVCRERCCCDGVNNTTASFPTTYHPATLKTVRGFSLRTGIFVQDLEKILDYGCFQKHSTYISPLNSTLVETTSLLTAQGYNWILIPLLWLF